MTYRGVSNWLRSSNVMVRMSSSISSLQVSIKLQVTNISYKIYPISRLASNTFAIHNKYITNCDTLVTEFEIVVRIFIYYLYVRRVLATQTYIDIYGNFS